MTLDGDSKKDLALHCKSVGICCLVSAVACPQWAKRSRTYIKEAKCRKQATTVYDRARS